MQAQAVRVIVRLPYNRPEHSLEDPVPVSQPASQLFISLRDRPMYPFFLGFMEPG
jgi:hypothetical protein